MTNHKAQLKNLQIAPRKVRLIADFIRGMSVNEAEARLLLDRHRASKPILKLLRSAVNGAEKKEMDPQTLFISEIRVDQGPMLKRYMPRAQGRGVVIQKKMSHVILGLGENPAQKPAQFIMPVKAKRSSEPEAKATQPKRAKKADSEAPTKKESGTTKRGIFRRKSGDA